MSTEHYFSLGGFPLIVRSETQKLGELFHSAFHSFRTANNTSPETITPYLLELDYCTLLPSPVSDMTLCYEGPLLSEGHCRLYSSGEATLCVLKDKAALFTDYRKKQSKLCVLQGCETAVRGNLAMNAFVDVGFAGGQFVVHAGALALPGKKGLVLIHAPSGTGKTTTCLSLIAAGFSLGSDDLAFVLPGNPPLAYGFPRSLKVHKDTAAMLPWAASRLADKPWSDEDERPLPLENLKDFSLIESPKPVPVVALFRLARTTGESCVVPIGQADMLATLAADNVRIGMSGGMLPIDQKRFEGYAGLVKSVPTYELRAGKDLDRLGGLVQRACSVTA